MSASEHLGDDSHVSRRELLTSATLTAMASVAVAARSVAAEPKPRTLPAPGKFPLCVLASANALTASEETYRRLLAGEDTLDAVVAGVTMVENDPADNSVGYGGLPNEEGVVQLDAAVMHGPTHRAGAVAALEKIRHPAQVARLVMQHTDHVLLVGEGALRFARSFGFQEENLLTESSRKIWLYWKQSLSNEDDWLTPSDDTLAPEVKKHFNRPTGTVHCAALNRAGEMSCCTSTSGLAFKIPGRVGDSPILGAGLYVDNEVGSCGSTGRGEANLLNLSSFAAVELMRGGMSPRQAGLEVLRRIAAKTEPRLRDKQGRPDFQVKLYLLAKDGGYAGVALKPDQFAVVDERGPRLEDLTVLGA